MGEIYAGSLIATQVASGHSVSKDRDNGNPVSAVKMAAHPEHTLESGTALLNFFLTSSERVRA